MGLFNLRKNKKYNYTGRFSEEKTYVGTHAKPKKIKSKFDEYRINILFRKKIRNAVKNYKKKADGTVKKRLIIILIILIALFLFIIFY